MRTLVSFLIVMSSFVVGVEAQKPKDDVPPAKPVVTVPAYPNATCPVMGKAASTKLFVDTQFGRIYVCCVACNKKIRQDPAGMYKAAYPKVEKVGNTICAVTGEPIKGEAERVILQGREINLCCKDCIKTAQENPQVTLAKAMDSSLKDLGNTTCPVTGKPVEKNTIVVIDKSIVHLSSSKCIEQVQQDPAGMLKKATPADKASESKPADKKPSGSGHDGHKHDG